VEARTPIARDRSGEYGHGEERGEADREGGDRGGDLRDEVGGGDVDEVAGGEREQEGDVERVREREGDEPTGEERQRGGGVVEEGRCGVPAAVDEDAEVAELLRDLVRRPPRARWRFPPARRGRRPR
jgi:hypothetical protein